MFKINGSFGLEVFVNASGTLTLKQDQNKYGEEPEIIVLSKREAKFLRTMLGKIISKIDADNVEVGGGLECPAD